MRSSSYLAQYELSVGDDSIIEREYPKVGCFVRCLVRYQVPFRISTNLVNKRGVKVGLLRRSSSSYGKPCQTEPNIRGYSQGQGYALETSCSCHKIDEMEMLTTDRRARRRQQYFELVLGSGYVQP